MRKAIYTGAFALLTLVSVTSCNNSSTTEAPVTDATPQEAMAPDSATAQTGEMAYVCPMKCEGSASMNPGKCPVCKMDLEKNPAFVPSSDSLISQ